MPRDLDFSYNDIQFRAIFVENFRGSDLSDEECCICGDHLNHLAYYKTEPPLFHAHVACALQHPDLLSILTSLPSSQFSTKDRGLISTLFHSGSTSSSQPDATASAMNFGQYPPYPYPFSSPYAQHYVQHAPYPYPFPSHYVQIYGQYVPNWSYSQYPYCYSSYVQSPQAPSDYSTNPELVCAIIIFGENNGSCRKGCAGSFSGSASLCHCGCCSLTSSPAQTMGNYQHKAAALFSCFADFNSVWNFYERRGIG